MRHEGGYHCTPTRWNGPATYPRTGSGPRSCSIPPCDSWVAIRGLRQGATVRPPRSITSRSTRRSRSAAQARGGRRAPCTIKTIEANTGLRIDNFMSVEFQGFQGMVMPWTALEVCPESGHPRQEGPPHNSGGRLPERSGTRGARLRACPLQRGLNGSDTDASPPAGVHVGVVVLEKA
ncbi:LCP family protein [Streptomyces yanii]|uniref:LCP family glycopolymer transferase n=1 Tax=Streptomyces yanii TaxID=78510 RepID=UPI003CD0738E